MIYSVAESKHQFLHTTLWAGSGHHHWHEENTPADILIGNWRWSGKTANRKLPSNAYTWRFEIWVITYYSGLLWSPSHFLDWFLACKNNKTTVLSTFMATCTSLSLVRLSILARSSLQIGPIIICVFHYISVKQLWSISEFIYQIIYWIIAKCIKCQILVNSRTRELITPFLMMTRVLNLEGCYNITIGTGIAQNCM